MARSRLVIATTLVAIALTASGYYLGERHGVGIGIRNQARVSEQLASERIAAAERLASEHIASTELAANNRLAKLTAEIEALRKERIATEKAAAEAPPYTASEQELTAETALLLSTEGLVLPKQFYIIAGKPIEIYWRTVVLARDPESFVYAVKCTCDFASNERRRVALTPPADARGRHILEIVVADTKGREIAHREIELIVVPENAGENAAFEMLMIGDSLGHQSRFPNRLAQLLAQPGNPKVTFVGSHMPPGAEIPHEQYGGWKFLSFTTFFDVDPKTHHRDRSPFVFGLADGKPVVDVKRYLDEALKGARPRNVHIQLGINDAFSLSPDGPDLNTQLSEIIEHAEALISELRKALPDAIITVGSVIQANASDRAFVESYPASRQFHNEWRWRQVQMKLARLMVTHFERTQRQNVFLVPTHMTVDPLDGYNAHVWTPEGVDEPLSNAVHPSHTGDKQLAAAIFGVVKAELGGFLRLD